MDKLRNIDDLLKTSLEGLEANPVASSEDWLAIENKLKRRKNRIYAVWFSLALFVVAGGALLLYPQFTAENRAVTDTTETPVNAETTITKDQKADQEIVAAPEQVQEQTPTLNDNSASTQEYHTPRYHTQILQDLTPNQVKEGEKMPIQTSSDLLAVEPFSEETLDMSLEQADVEAFELEAQEELVLPDPVEHIDNSIAKGTKGHWELGLSVTPTLSNRWVAANPALSGLINRSYFSILDQSENTAFAYNTAFNLDYHWQNGLYISSGIGISQRSETVDYQYVINSSPNVSQTENRISNYIDLPASMHRKVDYQGSNSYHFVEVPIQLGYRFNLNDRFELRSSAGVSYMILTNKIGKKPDYTYLDLLDLSEVNTFNKNSISATVSSGLYYNFKNFVIGAEPMFNWNLNSMNNAQSAVQVTPFNYGFNLTTNFKLGN